MTTPPPTCRHREHTPDGARLACARAVTRYLAGDRKNAYYCDRHGPSKISDWDRLRPWPPAPVAAAAAAAVVAAVDRDAVAAAMPADPVERAVRDLVALVRRQPDPALAEVLALLDCETTAEAPAAVRRLAEEWRCREEQLRASVATARAEQERLTTIVREQAEQIRRAEERARALEQLADEALAEVPLARTAPGPDESTPPPVAAPLPDLDAPSAEATAAVRAMLAAPTPRAPVATHRALGDLVARMVRAPRAPMVRVTPHGARAFRTLTIAAQDAVLAELARWLGGGAVRVEHPGGNIHAPRRTRGRDLWALRVTGRLRILLLKEGSGWAVEDFGDPRDEL